MKILVTGHLGFIGSHVFWKLRSQGHEVVGVDRKESGRHLQETGIAGNFDVIVHTAANLVDNFETNLQTTRYLLERFPQSKFIFLSSAAVYGEADGVSETDQACPFGEYGRIKFMEELEIKKNSSKYVILRLGNVYGYNSDHGIYSKFLNGEKRVFQKGKCVRDFVHVDDVVWMICRSLEEDICNQTFNVATGKGISVKQLFRKLRPYDTMEHMLHKKDEIFHSVLSIKKASRYGYAPRCL